MNRDQDRVSITGWISEIMQTLAQLRMHGRCPDECTASSANVSSHKQQANPGGANLTLNMQPAHAGAESLSLNPLAMNDRVIRGNKCSWPQHSPTQLPCVRYVASRVQPLCTSAVCTPQKLCSTFLRVTSLLAGMMAARSLCHEGALHARGMQN